MKTTAWLFLALLFAAASASADEPKSDAKKSENAQKKGKSGKSDKSDKSDLSDMSDTSDVSQVGDSCAGAIARARRSLAGIGTAHHGLT